MLFRSTVLCRHDRFICAFLFQVSTFDVSLSAVGRVASLLRSFARCKPTNQHAAHLYIHEHTIKGENLAFHSRAISQDASGGIEQHPGWENCESYECFIVLSGKK